MIVSTLYKYINSKLEKGWENYEVETLLLELKIPPSDLLIDKLNLIKVIASNPELFYTDFLFFLHACEVFNGQVADFTTVPHVTSLEAAFAIVDMANLQGKKVEESEPYKLGVILTIKHILIEDGYSYPVWPFNSVGITGLSEGATTQDMTNKERAIKEYISGTYSKPTN